MKKTTWWKLQFQNLGKTEWLDSNGQMYCTRREARETAKRINNQNLRADGRLDWKYRVVKHETQD